MRSFIILCVLVAAVCARPEEKYTDKYDSVNVQEILVNGKLLKGYVNCILDKGPCTTEGKELKSHITDALETDCAKCTDTQVKETKHVLGFVYHEKPEYWKDITAKYDADGKYFAKHQDELKAYKA